MPCPAKPVSRRCPHPSLLPHLHFPPHMYPQAQLETRVEAVRDTLLQLLENHEDLAGLYLTDKARQGRRWKARQAVNEPLEAELLLESFYRQIEEVANSVDTMQDSIRFTDNYVNTARQREAPCMPPGRR